VDILTLLTILLLIGLPLWWLARAAKKQLRLFTIVVEAGRITKVLGRIPQRLLDDVSDVIARERPKNLRLECRLEGGRAVVDFSDGTDPGLRQLIRNLIGEYPALRLKSAPFARRN
jgi:hypothetical protein